MQISLPCGLECSLPELFLDRPLKSPFVESLKLITTLENDICLKLLEITSSSLLFLSAQALAKPQAIIEELLSP